MMKKTCSFSFIALIVLLTTQFGVTSCQKEKIIEKTLTDTVVRRDTIIRRDTVIRKDTVVLQDTFLTTQILTAHAWKIQENRGVIGGSRYYYLRGGTSNTMNSDNEYILFRADNTGTYVEHIGTQRVITWAFANDAHTKITWTLYNSPATYSLTWENIRYKNGSLSFDEYYTDGNLGLHVHGQQVRIRR